MRRHPGWGRRGRYVLVMGGLAAGLAVPQPASAMVREAAGWQLQAVSSAVVTQLAKKPATATPRATDRAATKAPTLASPIPKPGVHADVLASARQLERQGRLPEAKRAYEAALLRYPQHVECLHRLGVVCTRLNEFDAARTHFERALLISPNAAQVMIDAGYSRYLAGDHHQAEKLLRQSLELAPHDVRACNNLAVVLGVTGRFEESLTLFRQANPPAKAWTNLAYVYQLRSEPELALICYQRARQIDESILIPEELLVATTPTRPLVSEVDLPPAPSSISSSASQIAEVATPTKPSAVVVAPASSPRAARATPSWARDDEHEADVAPPPMPAAVQPPTIMPAIGNVASEPPFLPPVITTAEAAPAEDTSSISSDSFEPQEKAAVTPTESASQLDHAANVAGEPAVQFEAPIIGLSTQDGTDPTNAEWLARERAKLTGRNQLDGLKGFCLVTLCEERRLEEAHDEFAAEFRGQKFTFCNAAAAERFRADPERYLPAAGGLDIVAVRQGRDVAQGSLDFAVWYRNRLYLFTSQEHKDEFAADPHKFITQ